MTHSPPDTPVLDPAVCRAAWRTDPGEHAARNGLRVRGDRVRVVVERASADGSSRVADPDGEPDPRAERETADDGTMGTVDAFGDRVQADVAVGELASLARREGVRAVPPPTEAITQHDGDRAA
jgi:hypothetical protein